MRRARHLGLMALAGILGVVVLVILPPATATASELAARSVPTAENPDFTPSGSKWQKWMVNILSSVLGAATPSGYKAEQIANQSRYNWGWETLNAQYGYNFANPNYAVAPDSYDDYILKKAEANSKINAYGNGPMRAPATKLAMFARAAGGAGAVYLGYEMGALLGAAGVNTVGGFFGFDANGAVCAPNGFDNDFQRWVFRTIAGQDCDLYDIAEDYIRNQDASVKYSANKCWQGAGCHVITGLLLAPGNNAQVLGIYCGSFPTLPAGWSYTRTPGSGSPLGSGGSFGTCTAPSGYLTPFRMTAPYDPGDWVLKNAQSQTVGTFSNSDINRIGEDPERVMTCKVTYVDNSTLQKISTPFTESQGVVAETTCPNTPVGKTPKSVKITNDKRSGSTINAPGTGETMFEQPTTPEYQQWHDTYPECATGACKLDLRRISPIPAVSCFDLEVGCPDWFTQPNKADVYECRYGIHTVELAECNVYAGIFQPGRTTSGAPYSNPNTGEWSGGQNSPTEDGTSMQRPVQNPESIRSCKYGSNPANWFLEGGQCLMEWSFTPRQTVVDVSFNAASEAWTGKPPQQIAEAVSNVTINAAGSGCLIVPSWHGESPTGSGICSGPLAQLPLLSQLATGALVVIVVFQLVRRQIAAMVNYNQGQD